MEQLTKGSVAVVKKFIDAGSTTKCGMTEMQTFWKVLSEAEKLQFTQEALTLMPELSTSTLLS